LFFDELRSCMGQRVIFRSTFEIGVGQKGLWEVAIFFIAQDVCSIEFVGQSGLEIRNHPLIQNAKYTYSNISLKLCLMLDYTL